MSKNKKIFLGILSFWPITYVAFFIFTIFVITFRTFSLTLSNSSPNESTLLSAFAIVFVVHFLTVILSFILIAYYIYHIYKNKYLQNDMKWIWGLAMVFVGLLVFPAYWHQYIWKGPTKK